jgi:hypothetical protein
MHRMTMTMPVAVGIRPCVGRVVFDARLQQRRERWPGR